MLNYKKFCIFILFSLSINFAFYSQNASVSSSQDLSSDSISEEENLDGSQDSYDDGDDLFNNDEEDVVVGQEDAESAVTLNAVNKAVENFFIPLHFSGNLTSTIGFFDSYNHLNKDNLFSGAFTFVNKLYFTSRIDKTVAIHGTIETSFPPFNSTVLKFSSIYLDYLLLDTVYLTAGKKTTSWGYTRIFSNENVWKDENVITDDDAKDEITKKQKELGFLHTDILYDSGNGASFLIRVPVWTGMISGIIFYNGDLSKPSFGDINFAGSVEMTIGHTSINIFGRKYAQTSEYNSYPLIGVEAKRTIFTVDFYAQSVFKMQNFGKFDMSKFFFTGGFYKLLDMFIPNFGFNFECQYSYDYMTDKQNTILAVNTGITKLGKSRDTKILLDWRHFCTDNSGYFKLAIIKGGIVSHVDWENYVEFNYNSQKDSFMTGLKVTTSIKLLMDY